MTIVTIQICQIRRFRHRGLRRLYEDDDRRGLNPQHVDLPGWRLHQLRGDLAGYWSITVTANWRVIFRFEDGGVADVDYLDYH